MSRLSCILIGVGMVGSVYADALARLSDRVRLLGVAGRSADSGAAFLARHPALAGARACASLDEALSLAPDFAILATPPNARAAPVRALVDAGCPILMEKPVERSLAAAEALVRDCEAAGVPLGIVLQHRFRPSALALAERLAAGDFGALQAVEIAVPWWRSQSYYDVPGRGTYARDGGGVMISQAIHTLDLALSFTGPVTEVTAFAATTGLHRMEAEDFVAAGLRFANGAVGTMFAATAAFPGRSEDIRLHFDHASAHLLPGELILDRHDGQTERIGAAAASGAGADPMAFSSDWHMACIADFAAAVRDGRPPRVTGRAALDVHRLIYMATRSAAQGRRITLDTFPGRGAADTARQAV